MEKYTEYFIKFTGGQFLWSEFRKEAISSYFLYSTAYAGVGILLGAYFGKILAALIIGSIFFFVALVGTFTLLNESVRKLVLIEGADINKAKYALYILLYTGVFGCIIVLLSVFGVEV